MSYDHIFKPINIGNIIIKNRIVMAPINNSSQMVQVDGTITQRCVDYFVKRAEGGTGLIITGVFKVENAIENITNLKDNIVKWPIISRKSLQQYADLTNQVHSFGAKIFVQLSAGPGRVTSAEVIKSGNVPVSASENQCHFVPSVTCRALKTSEVESIVKAFGDAAEIVKMVGFDGIEVHGHEGYLIDQFTTSIWNKRTDKYGGTLKDRLTFPIEILNEIKSRVGKDYPVTYRFGVRHFLKDTWKSAVCIDEKVECGRQIGEAIELAILLEQAGYNGFSVDTGCYESTYWAHPPYFLPHGFAVELTAKVKEAVSIPVMVAGRLGIPELAEKAIADGKTDMIALARDLLADPSWVKKVEEGDTHNIRPCLGCQDGCMFRPGSTGAFLSCSVNPECGRENALPIQQSSRQKRILIIGGGVAGMECARVAGLRGHTAIILEKTDRLGGHLNEASVPDFKDDIKRLLNWYKLQMKESRVTVKFDSPADRSIISSYEADAIIVATGSSPYIPNINGMDISSIATCCEVLQEKKAVGDNILIAGGGVEGCETALWLANKGKSVTIIEMLPEIATGIFRANRYMLIDLLLERNVKIIPDTKLYKVESGMAYLIRSNKEVEKRKFDTYISAMGMIPESSLFNELYGQIPNVYSIGDCVKPRRIHDAIWEGWNLGRVI